MTSKNPGCLAAIFGIKPKTSNPKQVPVAFSPAASVVQTNEPLAVKKETPSHPIYSSRGILLTNAEAVFFRVLRAMTEDHLIIFPHVALRDLVTVIDQSDYYTHYNKIDRKQVDFVLCDPKSLNPVFVIELDDKSHRRPDRVERDIFVEDVLAKAKIPLVRVPVRQNYDPKELGILFKSAVEKYVIQKNFVPSHIYTRDNPPFCPIHNVRMILRTSRRTGEKFWGCPNYPDCRKIFKFEDHTS
jgi:hypothetical protein